MPNFDAVIVSGVTPTRWDDERIQHRGATPHLYRRVIAPTDPALVEVVIHCVVEGVEAPLDGSLGGNLFTASRLAWSGSFPFGIAQAPGFSAAIALSFAHNMLGHQELVIRRPGGGAIILSFEVE